MKNLMKWLFIVMVFVVAGCGGDSGVENPVEEKGSISGYAKLEGKSDHSGINVVIEDEGKSIYTNSSGFYTIVDVKSGKYTIVFSKNGYRTKTKDVIVNVNQSVNVEEIMLEKDGTETINLKGISLNTTETEIKRGGTKVLTVTFDPVDATNKNIEWTSSDLSVASVSNGTVTAKEVGIAKITATSKENSKIFAMCTVQVLTDEIKVTGLTINPNSLTIKIGKTETIIPTVEPTDATNKKIKWSSSDEGIATVTEGVVKGLKEGVITITAKTEDGNFTQKYTVTVEVEKVIGITIKESVWTMVINSVKNLTIEINPENATNKNVSWSSDNPKVATVDQTGKVTAVGVGTAVITVKTEDGGKTSTCNVTVKSDEIELTSISLNKTKTTIVKGKMETLEVKYNPEGATNKEVVWTTSKPEIATVDKGIITAVGVGQAVITVTSKGNSKIFAMCTVEVVTDEIKVTGLKIKSEELTVVIGNSDVIIAEIEPSNATNQKIKWKSSDEKVVTVNNGKIEAIKVGKAIITAETEDGGYVKNCVVTVKGIEVIGITIKEPVWSAIEGENKVLEIEFNPKEPTNKNVSWISDNPKVATVDQTGKVTAVGVGTAVITVKTEDGSKTATCNVTVKANATLWDSFNWDEANWE